MYDLQYNSPVEEISDPFLQEQDVQLFIKRDDLIHPFISGNKWRKLKYLLISASEQKKSRLVTFGGAYSNHLLATACASARFGFKSTGFVRGEAVQNQLLLLCSMFGMNLIFIDRASYKDKSAIYDQHFKNDDTTFFIDEGGNSEEAVKGCAELISELDQPFDHVFCAAGTGTTAAGILRGLEQHQLNTRAHIIPVLKDGSFLRHQIESYFTRPPDFDLHLDYHFGGYAKTTSALFKFIIDFTSSTGILIDPVYTGKMFYAIYDMVKMGHIKSGVKILAIHTGGIFGIFGKSEQLYAIDKS